MRAWRHTAASLLAASAVLFAGQPGLATAPPAPAAQGATQAYRAATQIAADAYRVRRRQTLLWYRDVTQSAELRLRLALQDARTADQRQAAWRTYTTETESLRAQAHQRMQQARAQFRAAVDRARDQFGLSSQPPTFTIVRG
ncbi:MAG TPA: hypothetical protein PLT68_00700 [Actinomycetota bacterium]|nr:hypothetical protein [Actinomycetota bacterium]